jgi:ABC-type multidrug transport system fused ATPase/permease subunit
LITPLKYRLRYRPNVPAALNHVSFEIENGQKVGIFGRTGSGKSSLTNALYRLYPLESGVISIDQIDITKIGLQQLRQSMAIIPQESGLFTGSLRFNLDPANEHTDDQLWQSLETAGLKNFVANTAEKLELKIGDAGKNMSAGQRQLVCLSRTLLRYVIYLQTFVPSFFVSLSHIFINLIKLLIPLGTSK